MLELSLRDTKIKPKKLRRQGLVTGTLKRKNNEIIPISLKSNVLEKYILLSDYEKNVDVNFNGEVIHTHIIEAQRHFTMNNVIDMDFLEI